METSFILNGCNKAIELPQPSPRMDWEKSFEEMHINGDDNLIMPDIFVDEKFEAREYSSF